MVLLQLFIFVAVFDCNLFGAETVFLEGCVGKMEYIWKTISIKMGEWGSIEKGVLDLYMYFSSA